MRHKTLIAQLCDADLRNTNQAIGNAGELITIDAMPVLAQVEYMNRLAAGMKLMFDDADWQEWTKVQP